MIRPQLTLDLNGEISIDGFAGGGGWSTGYERGLGRHVDIAINHALDAITMHEANHPQPKHYIDDIWKIDFRKITKGRKVGHAHFSPDCTDHSKAKGGKPRSKRIRGLAWVALKCAGTVRPRVITLENVEEFQEWCRLIAKRDKVTGRVIKLDGTVAAPGERVPIQEQHLVRDPKRSGVIFRAFVRALIALGYKVEWRELRACDYGSPTIRRRFFLIARCDDQPIVWPEPTHGNPKSKEVKSKKLKPWRIAAECINFALPCPSIFLSKAEARKLGLKRPLVDSSCRRIAKGVERYVMNADEPFLVSLTHSGGERTESVQEPFRTITGAHRGEKALIDALVASPFITEHAQRNFPVDEPLRTQCAQVKGGHFAVAAVHLARQFGTAVGRPVDEPAATVMADGGGGKTQVVATFLAQHNTGVIGHGVDEPMSTLTGTCSHQTVVAVSLLKFYGTDQDPSLREPLHTVTARDRFGLSYASVIVPPLTPEMAEKACAVAAFLRKHGVDVPGEFATTRCGLVIWDIGMRMLTPRELYLAQGFPPDYIIDPLVSKTLKNGRIVQAPLSKSAQVRMCGNSVCPDVARAISEANLPEMASWEPRERKSRVA